MIILNYPVKLTIVALSADPKSANLAERNPFSSKSKRTLSPARKNSRLLPHSFYRDSFNLLLINWESGKGRGWKCAVDDGKEFQYNQQTLFSQLLK